MARRSLAQRGAEADLRRRVHDEVADFLDDFKDCGPLPLPDSFMDPLITLSDIVTRARSGVARDGYSRDLLYLPEPEAPTRLAKQLAQLGAALITMGVDEREAWRVVRKCGWDSVPAVRTSVLAALKNEPAMTMAAIEEMAELPKKTTQRVVEDLVALRLASRTMVEGKWYVEQSKTARDYWTEDSWPETSEGVQGTAGPRRRRDGTAAPDAAPKATEEDFWPAFAGLWQQAAVQTGNLVPKAILEPAIVRLLDCRVST